MLWGMNKGQNMLNLSHMTNMKIKGGAVFSRKQDKIFYQTKLSLTLRSASGERTCICRGIQALGGVRKRPEGHPAIGKRREGFGVTQTGLESHSVHVAV